MASGKKSFVLYSDIIHTVIKLDDENAGKLFKHILRYVNDQNPKLEDNILLEIAFEPIKQSLKRDLRKYENLCNRNRINGNKGGRPKNQKEPKKPSGLIGNPKKPKKADSDSDSDSDSDIKKKNIKKKKPSLKEVELFFAEKGFDKRLAKRFFDYYEINNWKDSKGKKVIGWKQKAIGVWFDEKNKQQNKINDYSIDDVL